MKIQGQSIAMVTCLILEILFFNSFWNLLKQSKAGGKFVSKKEDLLPLDEMQDHYMKLLQKETVCNSFNNEKIKPRNKLKLDQLNKLFDLEKMRQGIKRFKTPRKGPRT